MDWIGLCSALRPRQHSIGYMGDGFYRSKYPTNSIKVLKKMEEDGSGSTRQSWMIQTIFKTAIPVFHWERQGVSQVNQVCHLAHTTA